jgi:arylalkylamine N-acetyltransferase
MEKMLQMKDVDFRTVNANDVQFCADIEKTSYPSDEMASLTTLQYRQQNAAIYFRCATVLSGGASINGDNKESNSVIGFTCATRCYDFTEESMYSNHIACAPILAIHSVVVQSSYRRKGIATLMVKDYIQTVIRDNINCEHPIKKVVLLSKSHLLGFYVNCGFQVK